MKNPTERAKAALEWNDTDGLRLLAPDLARLAVAVGATVANPDWLAARIREFEGDNDKGAGAIGEYIATRFRAIAEGKE